MIAWRKERDLEKQKILDNQAFSWDQNPGEPNNAFQLFKLYLNIGKTRSYVRVTNLADSMSYTTICNYADKYNWKQRSNDFDIAKDQEMMVELDSEILQNKLRQLHIGKKLQDLAERGSEMLLDAIEDLSPSDVAKLADTGTKLANLALGSSTEITESKIKSESEIKVVVEEIDPEIAKEIGKLIAMKASSEMEISI